MSSGCDCEIANNIFSVIHTLTSQKDLKCRNLNLIFNKCGNLYRNSEIPVLPVSSLYSAPTAVMHSE
jgi:hypothetical protein